MDDEDRHAEAEHGSQNSCASETPKHRVVGVNGSDIGGASSDGAPGRADPGQIGNCNRILGLS
jgi:hypothetical protein